MKRTSPQPAQSSVSLAKRVEGYGCTEITSLDRGRLGPAQLAYLDLLPKNRKKATKPQVDAVAEHQGVALLYLVDDPDNNLTADERKTIQRTLANRSDPAWLGVVKSGSLEVFPIGFPSVSANLGKAQIIKRTELAAPLFFQKLAQGSLPDGRRDAGADYVFQKIFKLLQRTSKAFIPSGVIKPLDVLSMAGRALFFRFLVDRRIVLPKELAEICPSANDLTDVFSDAERAAHTSVWLDSTFNGDFLALIPDGIAAQDEAERRSKYRTFYRDVHGRTNGLIFKHLTAILKGWEVMGDAIQGELDWGDLDFAHIPVGVLSQVYESFSHLDDPEKAERESVHYTPRIIAEMMVDQAFSASRDSAHAHVLDPACGAGIFLVLAFRRLFAARWEYDEERPDYRLIQDILYKQVRGFEISESAIRLAALSLYITAIELNASPRPPKSLKFPRNLRGTVLHFFDSDNDPPEAALPLGSLSDAVAEDYRDQFDIVIGNPPWTRLREQSVQSSEDAIERRRKSHQKVPTEKLNSEFTRIGKEVLTERGLTDLAKSFRNPDKNPDLPFIWRATQWARKDGIIAFALPARVLQAAEKNRRIVWEALAKTMSVTGLINGADLRWSKVWDIKMPWCVLFARNRMSSLLTRFQFSALLHDPPINHLARFRIDYEAATAVSVQDTLDRPWLLKALSIGTPRDVEVMDRILGAFPQTLAELWREWDPAGRRTGKGFDLSPGLKQKPAPFLTDLPVFERPADTFCLSGAKFMTFADRYHMESAYWPKTEALYQPPLVIIPQSPGDDPHAPKAYRSDKSLAFSQSHYGYSTAEHPHAEVFGALLYLLAHSTLFRFFCLTISIRSGFDRQTFNKNEFDALPFPAIESLSRKSRDKILILANELEHGEQEPWKRIDTFLFGLYGLASSDAQTIHDTLFASASYRKEGRQALAPPPSKVRSAFCHELRTLLLPFFEVCGETLSVSEPPFQQDAWREPWFFVELSRGTPLDGVVASELLVQAARLANESGASRVIIHAPERRGLLLGVLSQQRWWTVTRARMCGRHILREHLDAFGIDGSGDGD